MLALYCSRGRDLLRVNKDPMGNRTLLITNQISTLINLVCSQITKDKYLDLYVSTSN